MNTDRDKVLQQHTSKHVIQHKTRGTKHVAQKTHNKYKTVGQRPLKNGGKEKGEDKLPNKTLATHYRTCPATSLVQQLDLKHGALWNGLVCENYSLIVAVHSVGNSVLLQQANVLPVLPVKGPGPP